MKNLRSALFMLALVSLICVSIPGTAFSQDGGTVPCCHTPPGIMASIVQNDIQPPVPANDVAIIAQVNPTQMPAFEQSVPATIGKATEMPVAVEESWTPNYRR